MLDGHIEQASRVDTGAIVEIFYQSLRDDPGFIWMIPDEETRSRAMRSFFRSVTLGALRNGVVLHRVDNLAASIWRPPGRGLPNIFEMLRNFYDYLPYARKAGPRVKIMAKAIRANQPGFPFRYLQFLGVAEKHWNQGMGMEMLKDRLARAAFANEPVYVETAKPEYVDFYRIAGFEIMSEWDMPDGAPSFTSLLKSP